VGDGSFLLEIKVTVLTIHQIPLAPFAKGGKSGFIPPLAKGARGI